MIEVVDMSGEIAIPIIENKKSHPVAFKASLIPNLLDLRKEKGIPYLIKEVQRQDQLC